MDIPIEASGVFRNLVQFYPVLSKVTKALIGVKEGKVDITVFLGKEVSLSTASCFLRELLPASLIPLMGNRGLSTNLKVKKRI